MSLTIRALTPEDFEAMQALVDADKTIHALPPSAFDPLQRYVDLGILPGDFLSAVLENDLKKAMAYADIFNRRRVFEYLSWLYNNAPMGCWGSPGSVSAWVKRHRQEAEGGQ